MPIYGPSYSIIISLFARNEMIGKGKKKPEEVNALIDCHQNLIYVINQNKLKGNFLKGTYC